MPGCVRSETEQSNKPMQQATLRVEPERQVVGPHPYTLMGRHLLVPKTLLAVAACLLAACGHPGTVVAGAVDIASTPRQVSFLALVPVAGPRRELCFDFAPPGESRKAGLLHAVLITTDGRRDTFDRPAIDRRGEARVCLVAPEAPEPLLTRLPGTHYRAVELRADSAVHVRAIRWWSGR